MSAPTDTPINYNLRRVLHERVEHVILPIGILRSITVNSGGKWVSYQNAYKFAFCALEGWQPRRMIVYARSMTVHADPVQGSPRSYRTIYATCPQRGIDFSLNRARLTVDFLVINIKRSFI